MDNIVIAKELVKIASLLVTAGGPHHWKVDTSLSDEAKREIQDLIDALENKRKASNELQKAMKDDSNELVSAAIDFRDAAKTEMDKFQQKLPVNFEELDNIRQVLLDIGAQIAAQGETIDTYVSGLHLVVKRSTRPGHKLSADVARGLSMAYNCLKSADEFLETCTRYRVEIKSACKTVVERRNYMTDKCKDLIKFTNESMQEYNKQRVEQGMKPVEWEDLKLQDAMKQDPFSGNFLKTSSASVTAGFKDVFVKFINGFKDIFSKIKKALSGLLAGGKKTLGTCSKLNKEMEKGTALLFKD